MQQKQFSFFSERAPRERRLLQFAQIVDRSNKPLTERQIAKRAGLKKTPYTRGIVLELVSEGTIVQIESTAPNGAFMWLYALPEQTAGQGG